MSNMESKEHHRLWKREWRKKNPEKERENAKRSNFNFSHSEKGHQSRVKIRNKRRQFIMDFFGNKCKRCGFSDARALQMDHIHGRKGEKRIGNVDQRYRFVRDFPEKAKSTYQLLCANCNFIKREENHEHFYHGRLRDYNQD